MSCSMYLFKAGSCQSRKQTSPLAAAVPKIKVKMANGEAQLQLEGHWGIISHLLIKYESCGIRDGDKCGG